MKLPDALRAIGINVWADLRPQLLGGGVVAFIFVPAVYLALASFMTKGSEGMYTPGTYMIAGIIGANGAFVAVQVMSEMYSERVSGTLLRVRIVPYGPLLWAIAKTTNATIVTLVYQVIIIGGAVLFLDDLPLSAAKLVTAIGLSLFIVAACSPIGFILGALVRGSYSMMFAYLAFLIIFCTSGVFFPLALLPTWAQLIQQVFPLYWSGHLARHLFLNGDATFEPSGTFMPYLAIGILLAWTVIGYGLVVFVIRRSFRSETISSLTTLQQKLRSRVGIS